MTELLAPVTGDRAVHRINPVAKIAAAAIVGISLITTIDWVSGAVGLVVMLALTPLAGVPWRVVLMRMVPIIIAAPLAGLTLVLYGEPAGEIYARFLLITISEGSLQLGLAATIRVLAIGLPAVLMIATVDTTDLADGLIQTWRLPARFVLGALAGLRMLGLLVDDWRSLLLARRARGVGDSGGVFGRIRFFGSMAFALLVLALRRAGSLATAMEARGFGGDTPRTSARVARFGGAEWALVLIGVAVAVAALGVSIAAGTFHPILGRESGVP